MTQALQFTSRLFTCASHSAFHVWNHKALQFLRTQWSRPNIQHDIVEFATCFLAQSATTYLLGQWEARESVDSVVHSTDVGNHVMLDFANNKVKRISAHLLMKAWEEDGANIRAFCVAPPCILIQINRFARTPSGRMVKHRASVDHLSDDLNVPVFHRTGTLQRTYALYKLQAVVLHHGASTTRGHYTCCLLQKDPDGYWLCDDNVEPSFHTDFRNENLSDVYVLLYRPAE